MDVFEAVRTLLEQAQTDPDDLQDLLNSIKRFAGSRPMAWVKELIQEFAQQAKLSPLRKDKAVKTFKESEDGDI